MSENNAVKCLLIGEANVGKTALLCQYTDGSIPSKYTSTVGIDFREKVAEVSGKSIRLQIWDTAGQERYRAITTAYYRGAKAFIIVYSITDEKSFEAVQMYLDLIKNNNDSAVCIALVGNQTDNEDKRAVDTEEAKKFAEENDLMFFETSAKNGSNVNELFTEVIEKILEETEEPEEQPIEEPKPNPEEKKPDESPQETKPEEPPQREKPPAEESNSGDEAAVQPPPSIWQQIRFPLFVLLAAISIYVVRKYIFP